MYIYMDTRFCIISAGWWIPWNWSIAFTRLQTHCIKKLKGGPVGLKIHNLSLQVLCNCFIRRAPRGSWKLPTVEAWIFFFPFMLVKLKEWGHRTLNPWHDFYKSQLCLIHLLLFLEEINMHMAKREAVHRMAHRPPSPPMFSSST